MLVSRHAKSPRRVPSTRDVAALVVELVRPSTSSKKSMSLDPRHVVIIFPLRTADATIRSGCFLSLARKESISRGRSPLSGCMIPSRTKEMFIPGLAFLANLGDNVDCVDWDNVACDWDAD